MWHIDGGIIPLFFIIVILIDIIKTNSASTLKDRLFKIISFSTLVAIVIDILSSLVLVASQTSPWWIIQLLMMLYLITMPIVLMLWYLYTLSILYKPTKKLIHYFFISSIPYFIFVILVTLNPVTGWMFELSSSNEYTRGPLFCLTFLMFYGYSAVIVLMTLLNLKKTERLTSVVLIIFPLLASFGIYVQNIMPGFLFTSAAFTLVLLINYLFLQNRKFTRDHLTGIQNRRAFLAVIEKLSKKSDCGFILAIAIDDFKLFNQKFGQQNGDKLLRVIAHYLVNIAPDKTAYRYGGDIFTLILKKCCEEDMTALTAKIMQKFASSIYINGVGHTLSASIGVTKYPYPSDNEDYSIITALDFAVYQAKKRGKGQIASCNEDLFKQFKRKYDVKEAITAAMENQSFEVYLHPIYSTKAQKFICAEALLRLNDPRLGFISPVEFIPLTEESGQIVELTFFVLEKVCCFIEENRKLLNDKVSIAVNFSVIQFMQNDMVDRIKNILKKHNVPPHLIEIEITESVVIDSFNRVKESMIKLHDFGISFALDDYGQGYSNISYLINLPFSIVKLDKSIIDHITEDQKFICALIPMFRALNKSLIAEGVETKAQFDLLNNLTCSIIQGYYFAKPMPMENAIEFFRLDKSEI